MPITARTTTQAVHRTTLTYTAESNHIKDGGKRFIAEVLDMIRAERQVGTLTIQFGVGGGVSTVVFEEKETIAQKDIEVLGSIQ
jgi:hypothetical protein